MRIDGQRARARLQQVGLRPTRQRVSLAGLLFAGGSRGRHVTAEQLHAEATQAKVAVSLATVYNTLHQFTRVGLLREVNAAPGAAHFDTNTHPHHHLLDEATGILTDIDSAGIEVPGLPAPPRGREVAQIDVVVRVRRKAGGRRRKT